MNQELKVRSVKALVKSSIDADGIGSEAAPQYRGVTSAVHDEAQRPSTDLNLTHDGQESAGVSKGGFLSPVGGYQQSPASEAAVADASRGSAATTPAADGMGSPRLRHRLRQDRSPSPQPATERQQADNLSRRTAAKNDADGSDGGTRTSMSDSEHRHTSRARPDKAGSDERYMVDQDSEKQDGSTGKHALRMANRYEVKDHVCEDSKIQRLSVSDKQANQNKRIKHFPRDHHGRRAKSFGDEVGGDMDEENQLSVQAGGFQTHSPDRPDQSDRIPGVFYDDSSYDSSQSSHDFDESKESTLHDDASGDGHQRFGLREVSITPEIRKSASGSAYDGSLNTEAIEYIEKLQEQPWIRELIPGLGNQTLGPWNVMDHLLLLLPKQPAEMKRSVLAEIQTIFRQFSHRKVEKVLHAILTALQAATDDPVTLAAVLDTLESIGLQMDVVVANILSLLPGMSDDARESVLVFLTRLGLVDTHRRILAEALSWDRRRHRRTGKQAVHKALLRKAVNFIGVWSEAFETHSKLIAEEINQRKMQAVVKLNIIKILQNYEPQCVYETSDGINVSLRSPASADRLQNPGVIEALNYFVELTDDEGIERPAQPSSPHSEPAVVDPLQWRRRNFDILVPPSQTPALQGNRPLRAGVLWPTSLVTHHPRRPGLALLPWPTVTVGITLRIADKYYRAAPPPAAALWMS
ncbi:uncharacterized protein LOC119090431 isoform X1 [Pollicipes pollicipes]|uniref:uncharacterized protein LOC119090431 isoform X1 n=1 Tax=Pollicipes pollicipes TaxID=41117 RepID=UPI001884A8A2|nr:uncharacterized protein LOC119090431 isoform X1 [Pollicipes pollicipes]